MKITVAFSPQPEDGNLLAVQVCYYDKSIDAWVEMLKGFAKHGDIINIETGMKLLPHPNKPGARIMQDSLIPKGTFIEKLGE